MNTGVHWPKLKPNSKFKTSRLQVRTSCLVFEFGFQVALVKATQGKVASFGRLQRRVLITLWGISCGKYLEFYGR